MEPEKYILTVAVIALSVTNLGMATCDTLFHLKSVAFLQQQRCTQMHQCIKRVIALIFKKNYVYSNRWILHPFHSHRSQQCGLFCFPEHHNRFPFMANRKEPHAGESPHGQRRNGHSRLCYSADRPLPAAQVAGLLRIWRRPARTCVREQQYHSWSFGRLPVHSVRHCTRQHPPRR